MASRKYSLNSITLEQIGIEMTSSSARRIRMFDHLTPRLQNLYEAKRFKTTNGFKFCWARNNQVYLRKSDNAGLICVNTLQDLSNLIERLYAY